MKKLLTVVLIMAVCLAAFAGGAQEAQTSAAAEQKDTLTIGTTATFASLTPFQHFSVNTGLSFAMYEYLGGYDASQNFVGVLAKDWSSEDGLVYDIEIYDYIYDTKGNHITAEDVAFCYDQLATFGTDVMVESVVPTGEYTVKMTLNSKAIGGFQDAMTYVPIISKAEYEKSSDFMASNPVGTAHYFVTDYVPGSSVTLAVNENYWQKPELYAPTAYANFKTLKFLTVAEAANQTIALETNAIDAFLTIDTSQQTKFTDGAYSKDFMSFPQSNGTCTLVYLSGAEGSVFADDLNLRLAVLHAIDRDAMCKGMTQGTSVTAKMFGNHLVSDVPTIYNDDYMVYDPELAKEYLAKSNYKGQTLRYLTITNSKDGQILQQYLSNIGINIEVMAYDLAVYQQNYADPTKYDFALCQNSVPYNSSFWQKQYTYKKGNANRHGWVDPELFDQILLTNTIEGHTQENIDKTAKMLDERAYGMSLFVKASFNVIRNGFITDPSKVPSSRNGFTLFWTENK